MPDPAANIRSDQEGGLRPGTLPRTQAVVSHDMIADVQDDLNGQLEIPLDISNHKRIFDELLKRPAPQYSQQTDVFAQFPKALCDQHWISQSRSPLKDAS